MIPAPAHFSGRAGTNKGLAPLWVPALPLVLVPPQLILKCLYVLQSSGFVAKLIIATFYLVSTETGLYLY